LESRRKCESSACKAQGNEILKSIWAPLKWITIEEVESLFPTSEQDDGEEQWRLGDYDNGDHGCPNCGRRHFVCAKCGESFTAMNSVAEREAEAAANGFTDLPVEDSARVCDGCYDELQRQHPDVLVPRNKEPTSG